MRHQADSEVRGSSFRLSDVVLETGQYWALRVAYGFDVYKIGATHSTRCAIIGWRGEKGMDKVREEIARRMQCDAVREAELKQRQKSPLKTPKEAAPERQVQAMPAAPASSAAEAVECSSEDESTVPAERERMRA